MRPYLAIIKDSFRAAMASRVLYVLLLMISILLLALAPFHLRETLDWKLQLDSNVPQPAQLMLRIVERHSDDAVIARIWELLPDSIHGPMLDIAAETGSEGAENSDAKDDSPESGKPPKFVRQRRVQENLVRELNKIIENRDFYQAETWQGKPLSTEAENAIAAGIDGLSDVRVKRLNRLLIANAVSPTISLGNATALDFYYGVWKTPLTVSITHQQFAQILTAQLAFYFDKFVMSIGLLIAIIVTANMVPETFEPGSLNLLLSKPIWRWGLYVAKFLGGCVFIALCAGYLFLGVWLWMGLAMEVWDRAVLLSIPLYIIVFAIYFSVSAFVGLVWRSAIVSVILTLLFWAICFSVGSLYGAFNLKMNNAEFVDLLPIGDRVYGCDLLHQVYGWDPSIEKWDLLLPAELGEQGKMGIAISSYLAPLRDDESFPGLSDFIRPVHDGASQRIFSSRYKFGGFFSGGSKDLFVSDDTNNKFDPQGRFPRGTLELSETPGGLVAVTTSGLFFRLQENDERRSEGDPAEPSAAVKSPSQPVSNATSADLTKSFRKIGPDKTGDIRSSEQVDYNSQRDEWVVYRNGELSVFSAAVDGYELRESRELKLDFEKNMTAYMATGGPTIFIAFGNGKLITFDAVSLSETQEYAAESRSAIRQVEGSPDGRYFGALYRNGKLWWLDTQNGTIMKPARVTGQGHIGAFAFGQNDDWWIAENTDRVTRYQLSDASRIVRYAPAGGWIENCFRYGLRPLYRVCPKPGEFYKVVSHLSSSGDTTSNEDLDLNKSQQPSDPWLPLWSGLAFMFAMLTLGCLVFQYKDY